MPRKPKPKSSVIVSSTTRFFFSPICAARTAQAIVRLEQISTSVLMPPRVLSRYWCA